MGRVLVVLTLLGALVRAAPATASVFTNKGTQPILSHALLPPSNCGVCHGNYDVGNDVEPGPTWQGSMMAQAARDPLFWAALDVANHDAVTELGAAGGIGEWCLRCHAPGAFLAGRAEPPGGSTDGCGLSGKIDLKDNDFDGVDCHFCHRLMTNPTPPLGEFSFYLENGQVWVDDGTCGGQGEPCRRGPYDYPVGSFPPPHPWERSTYHQESKLCGACHNVTNPVRTLIDANGVNTGISFPIERTYDEWHGSDFGLPGGLPGPDFAECQHCHMPDATANPAFACAFALNDHTGDLPMHDFVGGNAWIPDVLRQEYPALGSGAELARATALAVDMLQNQSALIEIDVPDEVADGGTLNVAVKVTNRTGHKLPTGYPEGRRMWLHVEARDATNALVGESGAYDAATGVLTEDAQIKVYESLQGEWNAGTITCETASGGDDQFHFVLNNCVAKDNRIPPKGFRGMNDPELRPVGYTYPETSPGSGILVHHDTTNYSFALTPGTPSPVTVTATLRYQTASKEYVDFLRDEAVANAFPDDCIERTSGFPTQSRGELLHDMWLAYGRSAPVDMEVAAAASDVVTTPIPGTSAAGRLLLIGMLAVLMLAVRRARRTT